MRLITNERILRDLELMLEKGTYRIKQINRTPIQRDYYLIDAPGVCRDIVAVLVQQRPDWGKRFFKKTMKF